MGLVAGVVIERDGKFLLVQEALDKSYGKWNLPGGHVDKCENLKDAAIREAREECGVEVNLQNICFIGNIIKPSGESSVYVYFTANIQNGELKYDSKEIMNIKWFSYEELLTMKASLREGGALILPAVHNAKHGLAAPQGFCEFFDQYNN